MDDFQYDALMFFAQAKGRVIYADDMGARKTATTLAYLDADPNVQTALVVVPKRVHVDHWLAEARDRSTFVGFKGQGSGKQRAATIAEWKQNGGLYVTTYDSMKVDEKALLRGSIDAVVFDEGHRLKGRTTQVAKCSNRFAKTPVCLIVTGTPLLNHPQELWQYLHMLKHKHYTSFWTWAREHFHVTVEYHRGVSHEVIGDWKDGHEDIVRTQLMGVLIQREIAELFPGEPWVAEPDYLGFPIEMSPREAKVYKQLVESRWGKLPDGTYVTAGSAIVESTRVAQLASDWGNFSDGVDLGTKVVSAVDDIVEWVRDGVPVVAFVAFIETAHRFVQAMAAKGLTAAAFTGAESGDEKAQALQDFKDGKLHAIVGTYDSMGEGVDGLQYRSHKVALLDLHWTPEIVNQAIGRCKRSGQTRRVEVRRYYFLGTIEESKYKSNLRKVNLARSLRGLDLRKVLYGGIDEADLVVDDTIAFMSDAEATLKGIA